MIAAMMQPTFLPWAGYFAMIAACDTFVFLDDFQFQRNTYHHRNRLFVNAGQPGWVSVPVAHSKRADWPSLNEVRPLLERGFRSKVLRSLQYNYGRSAFFKIVFPPVAQLIERDWSSLADLNIALIRSLSSLLGFVPTFARSSAVSSSGSRSRRVAELLRRIEATDYLAAAGAEEYMRADGVFPLADVSTSFQNYSPVAYYQPHKSEFVPYLSVLDMMFQIGPEGARHCIIAGSGPWRPWGDVESGAR